MKTQQWVAVLTTAAALNLSIAANAALTAQGRHESLGGNIEKAKDVIGHNVVNNNGDKIGKVDDFVTDLESGRILYALVSSGGFLGVGDSLSAVPAGMLRPNETRDELLLNVDKEKLKNAPQFTKERANSLASPSFVRDIYNYYGVPATWMDFTKTNATFRNVHRASDILKMNVANTQDEKIGSVYDLAVDRSVRRVLYVIFDPIRSVDNGAGNLYPLPPMAFTVREEKGALTTKDTLVTDLDQTKLASVPHFTKDNWKDITSRTYAANVYKAYGKQFYWDDSEPIAGTAAGSDVISKDTAKSRETREQRRQRNGTAKAGSGTFGPIIGSESLIGWEVQAPNGNKLGSLRDLVVDLESGRILYGVIDEKGLASRDNHAVAPTSFQRINEADKIIVADFGARKLADAPAVPREKGEAVGTQFVSDVYRFWGARTWWVDPSRAETASGKFGNVQRASDLTGTRVVNSSGEDLAKVHNVMVDLPDGRVGYVLLTGKGTGRNADYIPVPPMALTAGTEGRTLVINFSGDQLQNAPRIMQSELQKLDDATFGGQVYSHYGKQPWWTAPSATGRQ